MTDALLGTWHLVHFKATLEDGTETLPYGPNAQGRITYTDSPFMSVQLWDPDRHTRGAPMGEDPAFFSYCGDWSLAGDQMRHRVQAATNPDWSGTTQVRRVTWIGDRLQLIAEDVVFDGKRGTGALLWERLTCHSS